MDKIGQNKENFRENAKLLPLSNASIAAKLATIDRARALPTLNVVLGSRFGGGGGWMDIRFGNFLGNVEYCLK